MLSSTKRRGSHHKDYEERDMVCSAWKHAEVHKRTGKGLTNFVEHFGARDELNTHLPLFSNIYKTIQKENKIQTSTIDSAYKMINDAVNIELEYGKYLLNRYPIMGVTEELMERTVHNYANDRLRKIGLDPIFKETDTTYLQKLVTKHLNMNEVKSNFFESNVSNYAKSSIDLDDF